MANVSVHYDSYYRTPEALAYDKKFQEMEQRLQNGKLPGKEDEAQPGRSIAGRDAFGDSVEISGTGRTKSDDERRKGIGNDPEEEKTDWIRDEFGGTKAEKDRLSKTIGELSEKYKDADFFVGGKEDDLAGIGGNKKYSVILSEDELKLLASDKEEDKEAREKLLKEIDEAMNGIGKMDKELEEVKTRFGDFRFGLRLGDDNTWQFFAQKGDKTFEASSILELIKTIDAEPKDPADDASSQKPETQVATEPKIA